jgi:nucleoside-diphosphate-sugar epimerase
VKTLLITGAAGFIGRRMTAAAQAAGWNVIGLDREVLRAAKPEVATAPQPGTGTPDDGGHKADNGAQGAEDGRQTAEDGSGLQETGNKGGADTRSDPTRYPLPATHSPSWIVADITADRPIELPAGIDAIVHLAGKAHALAEVAQDVDEYFRINTEGTRRMLDAAQHAGVRAFVLFSTVKAMGDGAVEQPKVAGGRCEGGNVGTLAPSTVPTFLQSSGPFDETCPYPPDTPYGQSKRAAEKLVLEGGYVPHPVVIRPCLVYGPTPKGNLEKMIEAVKRGRFPPLPEVGNKRSMVHIDDVIAAALLAAEHPAAKGQVFIAGDNEPFSTRQLFEWICLAAGKKVPRWSVPLWVLRLLGRIGDLIGKVRGRRFVFDSDALAKLTGNAWYSSAKLQRELGWRPRHTLRNTIGEMVGK